MSVDRVEKLLADIGLLDTDRHALVQALRASILALSPAVTEKVKYGGVLFSVGKPFCGIFSYARHVSLEFSAGAVLPDAFGVLEGQGKFRRHIKLASLQEIADKHVEVYVRAALAAALT